MNVDQEVCQFNVLMHSLAQAVLIDILHRTFSPPPQILRLRFPNDLRVNEVRRLLQSSRPVRIALTQKPEVRCPSHPQHNNLYYYIDL